MTMNDQEQIARADVLRRMETAARTQVGYPRGFPTRSFQAVRKP